MPDLIRDNSVSSPYSVIQQLMSQKSYWFASVVLAMFVFWLYWLVEHIDRGQTFALVALLGLSFGIVLQRSRFCFYCIFRDFFQYKDPRGLLGLITALAVGTLGYHAVFGAFLPSVDGGRLPPDAHIGVVSWILPLSALVFGFGMAIAGSCISAQLYRLGEGLTSAPIALLGAALGFGLGFLSWNSLYLNAMQSGVSLWLPNSVGYGGSVLIQLVVLGGLALASLPYLTRFNQSPQQNSLSPIHPLSLIFKQRWPTWVGGIFVGFIAVIAYFRVGALGVTAELGSIVRTTMDANMPLPVRLEGLDSFSGCTTVIKTTLLSNNGIFVMSLVIGSLIAALIAGQFKPKKITVNEGIRALIGGLLMGWGAMISLGCTVGVLLSGIMAAALSGWVFAVFCIAGAWLGWRLKQAF